MDWARILSTSSHHPIFQEILRKLEEPGGEIFLTRFNSLAQAFLIAGMKQKFPHPILVITPHQKQAEILEGALSTFLKQREEILLFPELETLPYEKFSSSPEITGERLRVLGCLFFPTPVLVVTSLNALSQKVISPSSFSRQFFQIKRGEKLSDRSFIKKLIDEGYQQVAMVEEKGEMSVRGAIIDFFLLILNIR